MQPPPLPQNQSNAEAFPSGIASPVLPKRRSRWKGIMLFFGGTLLLGLLLAFFLAGPKLYYIPSPGMEPTLSGHDAGTDNRQGGTYGDTIHDHILVSRGAYWFHEPKFGDIIVFTAPKRADAQGRMNGHPQEIVLTKRLIGLPGDTIEIKQGTVQQNDQQVPSNVVYRNNKPLIEYTDGKPPGYIKEPMEDPQPGGAIYAVNQPLKLGPNELFVMGDNRNDSNDSRFWGTLERNRVIGKVTAIVSPPERMKSFP